MSSNWHDHIVDFKRYCPHCEFFDTPEWEDPCDECLNNPINDASRAPVLYKGEKPIGEEW